MKKSENMPVWLRKMVLAQHNCTQMRCLVKGTATLCTCRTGCNKYDLTGAHVSDWLIIMIGPGGLLLVPPEPNCCLSFSFKGGVNFELTHSSLAANCNEVIMRC
jgi:hypothetical protein